jgi:D-beta-D-heptose 7-phosphate kinase/D-beta-D-heptose 1-phosphate adenosyltransferase
MLEAWVRHTRLLVVGDVMLDVLTEGEATRLSPEAPVPVVASSRTQHFAGGAGNAAVNAACAGDSVTVIGVVGRDQEAERLRDCLVGQGICADGLISDGERTTSKHRVWANGQQLVRLDAEGPPMSKEAEERLVSVGRDAMETTDALLLSDYGKGVCTEYVCKALISAALAQGVPVVVDPKNDSFDRYRGATVVTPNLVEARRASPERSTQGLDVLGGNLVHDVQGGVLITRGPEGMTLFLPRSEPLHMPTRAREVFDVTGAGDTEAAVQTAGLSRGIDLAELC